jgi:hypothetical protein
MATEPRTIETYTEYAERRRRPRATGTVRDLETPPLRRDGPASVSGAPVAATSRRTRHRRLTSRRAQPATTGRVGRMARTGLATLVPPLASTVEAGLGPGVDGCARRDGRARPAPARHPDPTWLPRSTAALDSETSTAGSPPAPHSRRPRARSRTARGRSRSPPAPRRAVRCARRPAHGSGGHRRRLPAAGPTPTVCPLRPRRTRRDAPRPSRGRRTRSPTRTSWSSSASSPRRPAAKVALGAVEVRSVDRLGGVEVDETLDRPGAAQLVLDGATVVGDALGDRARWPRGPMEAGFDKTDRLRGRFPGLHGAVGIDEDTEAEVLGELTAGRRREQGAGDHSTAVPPVEGSPVVINTRLPSRLILDA